MNGTRTATIFRTLLSRDGELSQPPLSKSPRRIGKPRRSLGICPLALSPMGVGNPKMFHRGTETVSAGRLRRSGTERFLAFSPMVGGSIRAREVVRRVYQSDMREGLREITNLAAGARVAFLRQQSDIVMQLEEVLEHGPRIRISTLQNVIVGKERALISAA
jgi:hypothetical protein